MALDVDRLEVTTRIVTLPELAVCLGNALGHTVTAGDIKAASWATCLPMHRVSETLYEVDRADFGRLTAALRCAATGTGRAWR